jgi:glycosyltransferase involved in cell wall biosynthesis
LKILFVVHGFPPAQVGGTEVIARNVARYMAKRSGVFVFAPAFSREEEGDILFDGVRIHRVFLPPDRATRFSDSHFDLTVDSHFTKFVSEVKPDVVMVWHTIGLSAGILEVLSQMPIPYAVFLTDFHYLCHLTHLLTADMKPCDGPADGTKCANCILTTVPRRLLESETCDAAELGRRRVSRMRELLQAASVIVAPSSFVKEKYVEFGLEKERVIVIPPGVDVRVIKRRHKTVRSDKLRFGYLGGNSELRGISLVLDAFNFIADSTVELVIAGQGMEHLLYTPVPRNTTVVGEYLPERVGEVLSKIDVLVVPSRCHESYNLLIREAFAAKIPVIVSDLRAQSDATREGIDGLHFKAGDVSDLASKMRLLKDRRTILVKLRRGIRNVPEVDRQAAKFEKLLRELVRRRKTHAVDGFGTALELVRLRLKNELSLKEVAHLKKRLEDTQLELNEIKQSLGYKFMRFYGRKIDRLFPDTTYRGKIKLVVKQRLGDKRKHSVATR